MRTCTRHHPRWFMVLSGGHKLSHITAAACDRVLTPCCSRQHGLPAHQLGECLTELLVHSIYIGCTPCYLRLLLVLLAVSAINGPDYLVLLGPRSLVARWCLGCLAPISGCCCVRNKPSPKHVSVDVGVATSCIAEDRAGVGAGSGYHIG
jgi:hypothetical protein